MASGHSSSPSERLNSEFYEELWRACAGPLVHLPQVGQRAFYFPQGHLEQVAASTNQKLDEPLPPSNFPSKILCRVVNIALRATQTDEVYAQITLLPKYCQDYVDKPAPLFPRPRTEKPFFKVLTATDTTSKLHIPQQDANECFPLLDMNQETPYQLLAAKDLNGSEWCFKHVFSGNPKRHLLTTGWKRFVRAKRLVSGDSFIFLRCENGELHVGTRRVSCQWKDVQQHYSASPLDILATACHAVLTGARFTVFYRPSPRSSPFIISLNKYMECLKNMCSVGMKFSMRFEGEDHLQRRFTGSIIEVGDVSTHWKDSQWRCLKVNWDEPTTITRPERVSPWEVDPVVLPLDDNSPIRNKGQRNARNKGQSSKRSQVKITGQPSHQNSARQDMEVEQAAREENMMNMLTCPNEQDWLFGTADLDKLICFQHAAQSNQQQQYWVQNVGQPNWSSLQIASQMCQHSWVVNAGQSSYQQHSNMSMGTLFSDPYNSFQDMLNQMGQLEQQGPVKDSGQASRDQRSLQIMGQNEPVHLSQLVFGSISSGYLPSMSPTIHFSEIKGQGIAPPSRVSLGSEESVQGETRKRKERSVEDAESGNDNRHVKSRIAPSQCGMISDSNQTHYSSASDGEPSIGKCNVDSPPVEGTVNAGDRPVIYRALDRIVCFLYQLKNYVPYR